MREKTYPSGLSKWNMREVPQLADFLEDNRLLDETAMWKATYDPRGLERDAFLSQTVYEEDAGSTATARVAVVPGIANWAQLVNVPIHIKANAAGAAGNATLDIKGENDALLGAKPLMFPALGGSTLSAAALGDWTREGGVYTAVYTGEHIVVLNTQVQQASTTAPGIVQLSDAVNIDSSTTAATSKAVKEAYDKAAAAESSLNTVVPVSKGGTGTGTPSKNGWMYRTDAEMAISTRPSIGLPGWDTSGVPTQYGLPLAAAYGGTGANNLANVSVGYATRAGTATSATLADSAYKFGNWTYNGSSQAPQTYVAGVNPGGTVYAVPIGYFVRTDTDTNILAGNLQVNNGTVRLGDYSVVLNTTRIASYTNGWIELRCADRVRVVNMEGSNWRPLYCSKLYESSSIESKKNVAQEDTSVVERLLQLKPVTYQYAETEAETSSELLESGATDMVSTTSKSASKASALLDESTHHGLIAEDVAALFPEAVGYEGEKVIGIRYTEFISPLIKAFQKQHEEIETLKAGMQALEARLAAMEAR